MAAVAAITITVDEKGAISAIQGVEGAFKQVEGGLRKTGSTGNVVMTELVKQQRQANDSAQLLSRTLGVELPRQLTRFLATSKTIGPILSAAFNLTLIGGFIVAITQIPALIENVAEALTHWKRDSEATMKSVGAMNKTLLESQKIIRDFGRDIGEIGLKGSALSGQQMRDRFPELQAANTQLAKLVDERERLMRVLASNVTTPEAVGERVRARPQMEPLNAAIAEQQTKVNDLTAAYLKLDVQKRHTFGEEGQRQIEETTKLVEDQQKAIQKFIVDRAATQEEAQRITNEMLKENNQELEKSWEQQAQAQAEMDALIIDGTTERIATKNQEREQQRRDIEEMIRDQKHAAEEFAQTRRQMAGEIAGLFDDITSGNIGQRFSGMFKRLIAGMVADWILGVRQMGAATSGTSAVAGVASGGRGGGVMSTILGGLGIGGGPGATPPFFPGAGGSMTGLPLSAGQGVSPGGALPAGASVMGPLAAGGGGGGGGILSRLGGAGAGLMQLFGAAQLAKTIGFGSAARGAAAGGIGAALGLSAVASIAPSVLGSSIGGIFGPIGIGIGAAIGGLIGLLGNRKKVRQRHDVHMQMFRDLQSIEDQYKFFGVDYGSARGQLDQIREQYAEQIGKLGGKDRGQWVDRHVDFTIAKMNEIETERMRRAQIMFSPPAFRWGGFVDPRAGGSRGQLPHFANGGEVPAILHAGEFVMRPEAVRQQGRAKLERMNEGREGGGITINGPLIQARTIDQNWLRNGGADQIIQVVNMRLRERGR